ncbi:MAG TPA: hypothetical protein PL074_03700, partial [Thermoflexales bacterium]|nr:hypothetical protein [Thermoflexales bacterium]
MKMLHRSCQFVGLAMSVILSACGVAVPSTVAPSAPTAVKATAVPAAPAATTLNVFAAASLTDAFNEVGKA